MGSRDTPELLAGVSGWRMEPCATMERAGAWGMGFDLSYIKTERLSTFK